MTNWADDIQDYEYPEPDDSDDDEVDTIDCPECGKSIYIEAIDCPNCGYFLTDDFRRRTNRPTWWTWLIALLIFSFFVTYLLS